MVSIYNEIKYLHKLNNPNIIRLVSAIDTNEKIVLVMEYFSSLTLSEYMKRYKKHLTEDNIKVIFYQIC